jgi:purine-binding chemotaxis protein CheW
MRSRRSASMSEAVTLPPDEVVAEEPRVPTRRLLVFEVSGRSFACDMEFFREIVPSRETTRLPSAPETVCGLINLRGTIVTVIDGGLALATPPANRATGLILLVENGERLAGILVDDVRDIHDVPIDQFASSAPVESVLADVAMGVVEIEGRSVQVLDIKSLVKTVFEQRR